MQGQAGGRGGGYRAGVNKKFLLNTVHGLKSHNKREEEEDCWRQHDLDRKAHGRRLSHDASRARRESSTGAVNRAASPVPEVDARQFWAEQKRKAMTAMSTSSIGTPLVGDRPEAKHGDGCAPRERERSEGSADRANLSDGDRKKRRKKEEKKAKKKKKRKRESRHGSSGSSSDSDVDDSLSEGGKASDRGRHKTRRKKSKKHTSRKKSKT